MAPSPGEALLRWYDHNARDLPWRRSRDPYAIWVAEVMLQQTRVETVIPYFERWMGRFPTVAALAEASPEQVLGLWEGLGYYGRARNLHRAAQRVVTEHAGVLPASVEALRHLPGIGRYTAAAIAAIAFGLDGIALDGNQRRVLARFFDLPHDPRTRDGERALLQLAAGLLPPGRASAFNQALMDLGATVCTPRAPRCPECPLRSGCLARARGTQGIRPVSPARQPLPHHRVSAAVLRRNGRVLIGQRPERKLLGGLWEFPGGKQERGESLEACLRRELREELGLRVRVGRRLGTFRHAYSHFRVTVYGYECLLNGGRPKALEHRQVRWVRIGDLGRYPMGKVDRAIARLIGSDD
ncbi:MAG: A/G-specific adenine glycosylase [Chloroflexota bacterium]